MKSTLLALAAALVVAGCQISPVVTDPEGSGGDHYSACKDAARDYCKKVVNPPSAELDRCVAEHAFRCVSGSR